MARRHRHEEHDNHERWLVSYADFVTLLFAFFVVMYAISSVNEGKYRVLSESLDEAFSDSPLRTLEPIQVGELERAATIELAELQSSREATPEASEVKLKEVVPEPLPIQPALDEVPVPEPAPEKDPDTHSLQAERQDAQTIADELTEALGPLIEADLIQIRKKDRWVEVEMKSHILFESGSALISEEAIPLLSRLAEVLARFDNPIQVEGFTDNQPIATAIYPSNWELSAARAASVVHLFANESIQPNRMTAIGHGEQRPIADNNTPEGRQKNRRVVVVVASKEEIRRLPEEEASHRPNRLFPAETASSRDIGDAQEERINLGAGNANKQSEKDPTGS